MIKPITRQFLSLWNKYLWMMTCMNTLMILLKFQCEFRKGYEMRNIVVTIRPKLCGNCAFLQNFHTRKLGEITIFFAVSWKNKRRTRDYKGDFAAVLTEFLRTFGCISNGLLIAKLKAYYLDEVSLNFISAYLNNRKQRTKLRRFWFC